MKKIFGGIKRIPKNRIVMLAFLDVLTVIIASFLALYIRYDFSFRMIPTYYMEYVAIYSVINIPVDVAVYLVFGCTRVSGHTQVPLNYWKLGGLQLFLWQSR